MTASNELIRFLVWPLPETAMVILCNCLIAKPVMCKCSMDLGTDYCYAGVLLALLRSLTQGACRVLGEV